MILIASIAHCSTCNRDSSLELTCNDGRQRRLIARNIELHDDERHLLLDLTRQ